ncbi:unnamed protein product [Durusdinium trenchii]|uniref:Uncharacterized protein n=1 Tax=Durusdinium trenchii TaxID=1381693 RepID=A0ABP0NDN1_9DINO
MDAPSKPKDQDFARLLTVGHSNHPPEVFLKLLGRWNIKELVDVRSIPSSGKFPHFKKHALQKLLESQGISYRHCPELGNKGVEGGILALLELPEGHTSWTQVSLHVCGGRLAGVPSSGCGSEAPAGLWCHRPAHQAGRNFRTAPRGPCFTVLLRSPKGTAAGTARTNAGLWRGWSTTSWRRLVGAACRRWHSTYSPGTRGTTGTSENSPLEKQGCRRC